MKEAEFEIHLLSCSLVVLLLAIHFSLQHTTAFFQEYNVVLIINSLQSHLLSYHVLSVIFKQVSRALSYQEHRVNTQVKSLYKVTMICLQFLFVAMLPGSSPPLSETELSLGIQKGLVPGSPGLIRIWGCSSPLQKRVQYLHIPP